MKQETQDKLDWLMNQDIDPKRSQIHTSVTWSPLQNSIANTLFYFERYLTIYYDELALWLSDIEDDKWEKYGKEIEELIDAIYKDAKVHNMWGVIYDW